MTLIMTKQHYFILIVYNNNILMSLLVEVIERWINWSLCPIFWIDTNVGVKSLTSDQFASKCCTTNHKIKNKHT